MLMKKLRIIFRQQEFPLLLFFCSLLLFVAPFQRNADKAAVGAVFFSLFAAWICITLLLFLTSRQLPEETGNNEEQPENPAPAGNGRRLPEKMAP